MTPAVVGLGLTVTNVGAGCPGGAGWSSSALSSGNDRPRASSSTTQLHRLQTSWRTPR
jgi:hypothetical protein